jgi:hypothetical protein
MGVLSQLSHCCKEGHSISVSLRSVQAPRSWALANRSGFQAHPKAGKLNSGPFGSAPRVKHIEIKSVGESSTFSRDGRSSSGDLKRSRLSSLHWTSRPKVLLDLKVG